MKPDEVTFKDMNEAEVVPMELFGRLGMLVVESRVPDVSPKGRVQGPHCPMVVGEDVRHKCVPTSFLCQRADAMRKQMEMLWKNKIPMCIEVLLYKACGHGQQRAMSLDFSLPAQKDHCLLLEQWTIQAMPCRSEENMSRPRELFQAVKSFLYFSQLSAWLNSSNGSAPFIVCYRISPPGEFCTSSFSERADWHTFPLCSAAKNVCLKVTTGSLPRRSEYIEIPCPECVSTTDLGKSKIKHSEKVSPPDGRHPEPPMERLLPQEVGAFSKRKSPSPPGTATPPVNHHALYQPTWFNISSPNMPPSHALHLVYPPDQSDHTTGAIPKRQQFPRSPTWSVDTHPLSAPNLDSHEDIERKRLPIKSPMVLMSKKSPGQTYYSKEETKPVWTVPKPIVSNVDSTDSDHSSPDFDSYLKNLRSNMNPLSPEEIKTYLADLSVRDRHRSPLAKEEKRSNRVALTKLDTPEPDIVDVSGRKSPATNMDITKSFIKTKMPEKDLEHHRQPRTQSPLSRLIASSESNGVAHQSKKKKVPTATLR